MPRDYDIYISEDEKILIGVAAIVIVVAISLAYGFLTGTPVVNELSFFSMVCGCFVTACIMFILSIFGGFPWRTLFIFITPIVANGASVVLKYFGNIELANLFFEYRFWAMIPVFVIMIIWLIIHISISMKKNGY